MKKFQLNLTAGISLFDQEKCFESLLPPRQGVTGRGVTGCKESWENTREAWKDSWK